MSKVRRSNSEEAEVEFGPIDKRWLLPYILGCGIVAVACAIIQSSCVKIIKLIVFSSLQAFCTIVSLWTVGRVVRLSGHFCERYCIWICVTCLIISVNVFMGGMINVKVFASAVMYLLCSIGLCKSLVAGEIEINTMKFEIGSRMFWLVWFLLAVTCTILWNVFCLECYGVPRGSDMSAAVKYHSSGSL